MSFSSAAPFDPRNLSGRPGAFPRHSAAPLRPNLLGPEGFELVAQRDPRR